MAYGPEQKTYKLIPFVIESFLKGSAPAIASHSRLVDWVYVDDVISAFVTAATAPAAVGKIIDLGSGVMVSVGKVVDLLQSIIPGSPSPQYSASVARRDEIIRSAEIQPAAEILGWQATTSLRDGLIKTVEWYRSASRSVTQLIDILSLAFALSPLSAFSGF
jgi:nucleoside-diphosphate-sugar epimerase